MLERPDDSPEGAAPRQLSRFGRLVSPGLPSIRADGDGSIAGRSVLSTAGVVLQGAVRFIFTVVVGNTFGKVALGAANAAISLALFASLLQPQAAATSATKFAARARGGGDFARAEVIAAYLARHTMFAAVALGAVVGAVAPWLLDLTWGQAILTGALTVTYSGYTFLRGVLFGVGMVQRATLWDAVSSVVAVAALILVVAGDVSEWILAPLVLGYGLYVLFNLPGRYPGAVESYERREMNGFLALTLVNSLATSGFLQLSMVVARAFDAQGAGAYAAALGLATPASLVSRSLSLVLFPSLATAHGRGDVASVRRQTDIATRALVVLSVATFGPLMLMSPLLIQIFFRDSGYASAAVLLPVLLVAVMFMNSVIGATNLLLTGTQRQARVVVVASVAGAAAGLLCWVATVPTVGASAVAIGYLVGSTVASVIPAVAAWRLVGLSWASLWTRFLAATAVAGVLCWWAQSQDWGAATQVLLATGFASLWLAVSWRDVRLTLATARGATSV